MNLTLIVVPGWLEQALHSAKAPLSVLCDTTSLLNILSKEDVAFYHYCQSLAKEKLAPSFVATIQQHGMFDLFPSITTQNDLYNELWKKIERFSLENPTKSIRPLYDGVIDSSEGGNIYPDYTYEIFEIKDGYFGLRLSPISVEESQETQERRSIDKFLKFMSTYLSFQELSLTPAFERFLVLSR